jgi:tetratricopeptide (TPR) repeat protein
MTSFNSQVRRMSSDRLLYSLGHLPEHLLKAKQYGRLFSLARRGEFLTEQSRTFPLDPGLALRTLRLAIKGAADVDAVAQVAEFTITRARLHAAITQGTPLEILRAGNLERARAVAELFDLERRALWHLLLAWELKDTGRAQEAQATLEQLRAGPLPNLHGWRAKCGAFILAFLQDEEAEVLEAVADALLLDDEDIRYLGEQLTARGKFGAATEAARKIKDAEKRTGALNGVAAQQIKVGEREAARVTLQEALEAARKVWGATDKAEALNSVGALQREAGAEAEATFADAKKSREGTPPRDDRFDAVAQARQGNFHVALSEVKRLNRKDEREDVLRRIAESQLRAKGLVGDGWVIVRPHESERSPGGLAGLLETAQKFDEGLRGELLKALAIAQARAGGFTAAWQTAQGSGDMWSQADQAEVWGEIARDEALKGMTDAASKDFDTALKLVEGVKAEDERGKTSLYISSALSEAGLNEAARACLAAAFKTWAAIEEPHLEAGLLKALTTAQARSGDYAAALETAQKIRRGSYKVKALVAIAGAQAEAGERRRARSCFDYAFRTARGIKNLWLRAESLVTVMQAQIKVGEFASAVETALSLEPKWVRAWALLSAADAQARAGDREAAVNCFGDAFVCARDLAVIWRAEALREIAESLARAGEFQLALTALTEVDDAPVESDNLDARLAAMHGEENEWIIEKEWTRAEALMRIAQEQVRGGELEAAQRCLTAAIASARHIKEPWWRAETLKTIAYAQVRAGAVANALETALTLDEGKRWETVSLLTETVAGSAHEEAAQFIFTSAVKVVRGFATAPRRRAAVMRAIAETQAKTCLVAEALESAQQIEDKQTRAEALITIAEVQMGAKNSPEAWATFSSAYQVAESIPDSVKRMGVLKRLASVAAAAGDKNGANIIIASALKIVEAKDYYESYPMNVLLRIPRAQAADGQTEAAKATMDALRGTRLGSDYSATAKGLKLIAEAQAEAGLFVAAIETAKKIKRDWMHAMALAVIAEAQAKAGEREGAVATFASAVEAAQKIRIESECAPILKVIGEAQVKAGERNLARATFTTARQTIQKFPWHAVNGDEQRLQAVEILRSVAHAQAQAKQSDESRETFAYAVGLANEIKDDRTRSLAMESLAISQALCEFGDQAVKTAGAILTSPDERLTEIACSLAVVNDRENFKRLLIPYDYSPEMAYRMCGLLTQMYFEHSQALAISVLR